MPQVHLPALLIEVDRDTRFSEAFTHAGGAQPRNPDLVRNLYAAVLAYACNLGYAGMSDASGISEDTLAWTSQWYLRQDTLREANARLVNAHHRHPLARLWVGGTLSSSDGQRFPQRGRSLTARALSRYFLDEGTTTYTHVSDQHSTYGTKVIPTTWREAVAVLDEIFGNATDLAIAEHTTDTAGQTLMWTCPGGWRDHRGHPPAPRLWSSPRAACGAGRQRAMRGDVRCGGAGPGGRPGA